MKITGWTDWENRLYEELPYEIYGEAFLIVAKEIRNRGIKFSGIYHQNGDLGVPIIDNKWRFEVSQRSWGHLMFIAYPDEVHDCDGWVWMVPTDMVLPNEDDYRETE